MENVIYVSVEGEKQGLISAGCSRVDSIDNRCQLGHDNDWKHIAGTFGYSFWDDRVY